MKNRAKAEGAKTRGGREVTCVSDPRAIARKGPYKGIPLLIALTRQLCGGSNPPESTLVLVRTFCCGRVGETEGRLSA